MVCGFGDVVLSRGGRLAVMMTATQPGMSYALPPQSTQRHFPLLHSIIFTTLSVSAFPSGIFMQRGMRATRSLGLHRSEIQDCVATWSRISAV